MDVLKSTTLTMNGKFHTKTIAGVSMVLCYNCRMRAHWETSLGDTHPLLGVGQKSPMNVESHKCTWPSRFPSFKSVSGSVYLVPVEYSTPNFSLPHFALGLILFFEFYNWSLLSLNISLPMLCSKFSGCKTIPKLGNLKSILAPQFWRQGYQRA